MTITEAKRFGRARLADKSPTPALDTDVLLMHVLACDKTHLLFHQEETLTEAHQELFSVCLQRRCTGLPIAYIVGRKEFFGYDFAVTPDVLIPKPDTELLVEKALIIIEEKIHTARRILLCDMCTGCGCVGLSIIKQCVETGTGSQTEDISLALVDISRAALGIARQNRDRLCSHELASKVTLLQSNLFQTVPGFFDVITANPPYVPAQEVSELLQDGRGEPALALNGDVDRYGRPSDSTDGLGIMRNLVPQAAAHLTPGGILLVEAGEYNAEQTERLFCDAGLKDTCIFMDLAGRPRVIQGRRS